jgi:cellulose synthase/poly-beta-1,6-N-acetylglucosamine synthase-like glycosyltransferase
MSLAALTFWLAAAVLGYTYVGYPLLLALRARLGTRPHQQSIMFPTVSILVVAHNEAARISQRIENLLAVNYDTRSLEIVIASDASGDATVALAEQFRPAGVRVVAFDRHRGKPAVLNDLIPHLRGEIVVLMDVRQHIDTGALHRLLDNFADPAVGAVSGELILTADEETGGGLEGIGFYWRYEKFIRLQESLIDSTIGATGALYALRRELFETIPEDTLLDDVLIPMQIARRGYRVLFEPAARASEHLSASSKAEFRRKVRTIAGNFQLFWKQPWLLNPFANRLWFATVSHKLSRLLCPAFLLLLLVANLWLLDNRFFQAALLLQVMFYLAALAAQLWPAQAQQSALLSVPHAFSLLNWCTVVGFYLFVRGQQQVTWAKASKSGRA